MYEYYIESIYYLLSPYIISVKGCYLQLKTFTGIILHKEYKCKI